jgi:hypothetical protein
LPRALGSATFVGLTPARRSAGTSLSALSVTSPVFDVLTLH